MRAAPPTELALSAVGAIAPSLRRAEIDRVKRKRHDSLDAYDLVNRQTPIKDLRFCITHANFPSQRNLEI